MLKKEVKQSTKKIFPLSDTLETFEAIHSIAKAQFSSIKTVILGWIKLGLFLHKEIGEGKKVIIKHNGTEYIVPSVIQ